uniref:Src kinase associated phosphoprotein 2 n=1 Tax=Anas platyrhynchos platyrhynchos TaxID=8840 RepID=A0A493STS8_ANAPP
MNNNLRKDAKKDCCFEISAPDKRIYQFAAATPKEAEEWVQQVKFVIQDMESNTIPEEEEEYDDVGQASSEPIDDSIYEELPEESASPKAEVPRKWSQEKVTTVSDGKNTDYANFYQGLWDCTGDVPDELSFKRGDVIYILSKVVLPIMWRKTGGNHSCFLRFYSPPNPAEVLKRREPYCTIKVMLCGFPSHQLSMTAVSCLGSFQVLLQREKTLRRNPADLSEIAFLTSAIHSKIPSDNPSLPSSRAAA